MPEYIRIVVPVIVSCCGIYYDHAQLLFSALPKIKEGRQTPPHRKEDMKVGSLQISTLALYHTFYLFNAALSKPRSVAVSTTSSRASIRIL